MNPLCCHRFFNNLSQEINQRVGGKSKYSFRHLYHDQGKVFLKLYKLLRAFLLLDALNKMVVYKTHFISVI